MPFGQTNQDSALPAEVDQLSPEVVLLRCLRAAELAPRGEPELLLDGEGRYGLEWHGRHEIEPCQADVGRYELSRAGRSQVLENMVKCTDVEDEKKFEL